MSYDRAEFASSKFVNAMGIRRMYSLLERIFDRSAHLLTISMARQMMNRTQLLLIQAVLMAQDISLLLRLLVIHGRDKLLVTKN